jgi:hypothetical protein
MAQACDGQTEQMTAKNSDTPIPRAVSDGEPAQQILWAAILLIGLVALFYWTSAPPPEGAFNASQLVVSDDERADPSEEPEPPVPLPSQSEDALSAGETHVEVRSSTDPQSGWLRIAGVATAERKSSARGRYRRNNEFDIDTANVDRIDVRLADLNVNRTRRFIFHIDGQDMLVFPDEIGTISFVRSPEGLWVSP